MSIITVCVCVKIGQISRGTGLKPPGIGLGYLANVRSVKIQRGVKISRQKYQEQGELEGGSNKIEASDLSKIQTRCIKVTSDKRSDKSPPCLVFDCVS